jgi:hypothetical protein
MPRYFFHVLGGADNIYDKVGAELADNDAALALAPDVAKLLISDTIHDGTVLDLTCFLEVCDAAGETIGILPIRPLIMTMIKQLS